MIHPYIDVKNDLFEDLELLSIFIHPDKLLQDLLGNELISELTCDNRHTQVANKLIFKVFILEVLIDIAEKITDFIDLQAKLN